MPGMPFNQDHYVAKLGGGSISVDLACLRCGARVWYPASDAAEPTTVHVHDVFHERLGELWADLISREDSAAEQSEREA